ncbi:helix-turn-helix domain-containing protein [Pyrobaculum aerophilum]|uniref:helix-turn-helix domain-containing protein n=1 Tax=Pyrobaculum aerophilum TaxID=13773 RepID=UPI002FD92A13
MPVRCNCREAAKRLLELGLSYSEAARVLGVSEKTVKRWVGGQARQQIKPPAGTEAPAVATEAGKAVNTPVFQNEWVKLLRNRNRPQFS